MPLVVYELVLVADGGWQVLEDEIFQPAVAAFGNAPLPRQVEPVELDRCDDVERATRIAAVAGIDRQQPVFDLPPCAGGVGFLVAAPAVERLPVKEKNPAGLLFRRCELVDRLSRRRGRWGFLRDGRRRERRRRRHRSDRRRDVVTQIRHGSILLSLNARGAPPLSTRLGPTPKR